MIKMITRPLKLTLHSVTHPIQTGTPYWVGHKLFKYGGMIATLGSAATSPDNILNRGDDFRQRLLGGVVSAGKTLSEIAQAEFGTAWEFIGNLGEQAWQNLYTCPGNTLLAASVVAATSYFGARWTGTKRSSKVWDYEF